MVLFILALVWGAVLIPPYLRNRGGRSADSISSFRTHLSTLERTTPGARGVVPLAPRQFARPLAPSARPAFPAGRSEVRRRRRDILFTLAGAVGITFVLAVALGGIAYVFFLVASALLGGYVYLLVQMRRSADEQAAKVRYLAPVPAEQDPAFLLRRSASN